MVMTGFGFLSDSQEATGTCCSRHPALTGVPLISASRTAAVEACAVPSALTTFWWLPWMVFPAFAVSLRLVVRPVRREFAAGYHNATLHARNNTVQQRDGRCSSD
jgi:hypothetical protein